MQLTKKWARLPLLLTLLVTLLSACGTDNTPTPASGGGSATATTSSASSTATTGTSPTTAMTDASPTTGTGTMTGIPAFGSKPVDLQIFDGGGLLLITKKMIENYRAAHPERVGKIDYLKGSGPETMTKVKTQEDAGKAGISLVLAGYDAMSGGSSQGLWQKVTDYSAKFPDLDKNYLPPAKQYNDLTKGNALTIAYTPSGPLLEYDSASVPTPPKTIEELRTWIKANPNKFVYARPANSGPGRTFLMGLPYLLGDKDPKDPINGWDKTWAFLKDIDGSIEYYPSGTTATMKELAAGTRWMLPSTMGWDINPRATGIVPKEIKTTKLDNTTFVADAQFLMIPKGLDNDHLAVVLDLMAWMLQPKQQAYEYDTGYFYPGPVVSGVDITQAPQDIQDAIKEFGRPEYDGYVTSVKPELPLSPENLVAAFKKWDTDIGGSKVQTPATAAPTPKK